MQFTPKKRVNFSPDLPAEVQTAYLRHTIQIQFEQLYVPPSQRTELSLEELETWCDLNCADIHSITKWSHDHALFRFYAKSDMQSFEQHLKDSVATASDHTS